MGRWTRRTRRTKRSRQTRRIRRIRRTSQTKTDKSDKLDRILTWKSSCIICGFICCDKGKRWGGGQGEQGRQGGQTRPIGQARQTRWIKRTSRTRRTRILPGRSLASYAVSFAATGGDSVVIVVFHVISLTTNSTKTCFDELE